MLGLLLLMSGCGPSTSPSPSDQPSASPSELAESGLPPGCGPIELRGPSGERIELDGQWIEIGDVAAPMTWWIRTQGDCVWGTGHIEGVGTEDPANPRPSDVQTLSGVIGSDFVITGEILLLAPLPPLSLLRRPHSPLRMLIEFDAAGEITLREDREPGVSDPRCPDPVVACLAPLVLEKAD